MNESNYDINNNYNYTMNNSLSSVLVKLDYLKKEIDSATEDKVIILKNIQKADKCKNEIKNMMVDSVSNITNNLEEKVRKMLVNIKNHSEEQRSYGLKIQQEIATIKKEKYDLLNQVSYLNKRIQEIETLIGYDPRNN